MKFNINDLGETLLIKKLSLNPKFAKGPCPFLDKYKDGTFTTSLEGVLYQMENIIKPFPKIFDGYNVSYFKERYTLLKAAYEKLK